MDPDSGTSRSYTVKELRALIQRATELQEADADSTARTLSLPEVEAIAVELGIPAAHLHTAAFELEAHPDAEKPFSLWGAPFVVGDVRVAEGTVTQQQWKQAITVLRDFTGQRGEVDELGAAREWAHYVGEGADGANLVKTRVALRPGDGKTAIHVRKHYGGTAIPAYVGAFLISAVLSFLIIDEGLEGMGLSNAVNFALLGGGILTALAAVRGAVAVWARQQRKKVKQLTDLLHQTLSVAPAAADQPIKPAAEEAAAAEAGIPLPDEADAAPSAAQPRQRRRA